jgi:Mce-associated membrane protein
MPPQRRRRPVQPATHVRLPRAARPRGTSATDTTDLEAPELEAPELEATDVETANGLVTEPATDEPATEPATDQRSATDEPATDEELATDQRSATDDEPAADEASTVAPKTAARERRRSPLALPAALGVIAVILGGLAVWFGLEAGSATSGVDTSNVALTDPAATTRLTQQITSAVNTIFSYNYADTSRTSQAAATLLTGKARGEYNTLFKLVRQDAPKEKLVLTTTVTNAGVEYLIGNQARVLVFANQKDTAGAAHNTTEAGAMFAVNAVYQDGRWEIAHIDTFGASG